MALYCSKTDQIRYCMCEINKFISIKKKQKGLNGIICLVYLSTSKWMEDFTAIQFLSDCHQTWYASLKMDCVDPIGADRLAYSFFQISQNKPVGAVSLPNIHESSN